MNSVIFELEDVFFSYLGKFPALRGIDFKIREGERITVIGANGSGKTTLLHMLDGLIFPDQGIIKAFGRILKERDFNDEDFFRGFRKKVGLVFQNPDIQLFCPTVKEDILFGPLQLGINKEQIKKRLQEVVAILGIEDLLERAPHQLSIGEKRKVAIASTLIIEPDILLLDEPTAGLDPFTSRQIIDIIIHSSLKGKSIVTATHDLHLAEEISDLIYVFNKDKQISRFGNPQDILKDTDFLRMHNLIHIHSHRHEDKIHTHLHTHT